MVGSGTRRVPRASRKFSSLRRRFDVLQTGAVAQGVVGDVEHVVGFVVGQVQLEQVQASIDGVDQADPPCQQVHGPDAAAGDGPGFGRDLVMNVAGRELRFEGDRIARLVKPAFDPLLAIAEPAAENGLHLKSFRGRGAWECCYFLKHRRTPKDFRFFQPTNAKCEQPSLVQGLAQGTIGRLQISNPSCAYPTTYVESRRNP